MWTMVRASAVLLVLFIQNVTGNSPGCPGATADIAFLLDGSGSVSSSDFTKMKIFVETMISKLLQGQGNIQFAVAQYSGDTTIHYYLDNFATSGSWESQIDGINQLQGGTNTAKAIRHVVDHIFDGNKGSRPNVNKFLIVISDGSSGDRGDLPNAASLAATKGIIRFAIGVGSAFNDLGTRGELDTIATTPHSHVFTVTEFGALHEITKTLKDGICKATTTAPTTTTTTTTTAPTTTAAFCVGKAYGQYPKPDAPASFYNCGADGLTHIQDCPQGLVFRDGCKCCDWP